MKTFLLLLQIVVSLALMGAVLVQHRKSGGFSGAFGGGTQADMSGGQWQRFTAMSKLTVVLMLLFVIIAFVLAVLG